MFGNKEFDGVGFPTPSSIPVACAYRLAKIPSDTAWLATFMGLLETLIYEENWQQLEGGITREDAAKVWLDIINDMYANAESPIILDVRQNLLNPCLLEKTFDNVNWETFADTSLCATTPQLRYGANGRLQQYDGLDWFEVADGPYIGQSPDQWFTDAVPTGVQITQMNDDCTAAANAAHCLFLLGQGIGTTLTQEFVGGDASEVSAALDTAVSLLLGGATLSMLIPIAFAFIAEQAFYASVTWSDADFRKLTCLIQDHMSGTDGNWVLDYNAIRSNLYGVGMSTQVADAIDFELIFIGPNGLNLAAKTTAIANYSCGAVSQATLWKYQDGVQWMSLNITFSTQFNDPTPLPVGFTRLQLMSTMPNAADDIGQGSVAAPGGFYYNQYPNAGTSFRVTNAFPDLWQFNSNIYATSAIALAEIRRIVGNPTYNPPLFAAALGTAAGQRLYFPWQSKYYVNASGQTNAKYRVSVYTAQVYAAC